MVRRLSVRPWGPLELPQCVESLILVVLREVGFAAINRTLYYLRPSGGSSLFGWLARTSAPLPLSAAKNGKVPNCAALLLHSCDKAARA